MNETAPKSNYTIEIKWKKMWSFFAPIENKRFSIRFENFNRTKKQMKGQKYLILFIYNAFVTFRLFDKNLNSMIFHLMFSSKIETQKYTEI